MVKSARYAISAKTQSNWMRALTWNENVIVLSASFRFFRSPGARMRSSQPTRRLRAEKVEDEECWAEAAEEQPRGLCTFGKNNEKKDRRSSGSGLAFTPARSAA
jgi:hypothetical protein